MNNFETITAFLKQTGTQFRIFDLGRRVTQITPQLFLQIEEGEQPYPYPLQQHAWLAILCWNDNTPENHFVWFLKFPLDEYTQLSKIARDDFLFHILESVGQHALNDQASDVDNSVAQESSYGFTPKQETMAIFHAKASTTLGLAPSQYYQHARDYLAGGPGYEQWAFVGLQGIADICARLENDNNAELLKSAIPHLPDTPFEMLCHCLENEALPENLFKAISSRTQQALSSNEKQPRLIASTIRALSMYPDAPQRQQLLFEILSSEYATSIEVLAAIAGRNWQDLHNPELCHQFMEALAANEQGQEAFNAISADLLFIPGMREILMEEFRSPQRSTVLSSAIGALFNSYQR